MSHLTFYMGIKKKVMSRIHQFRIGDNLCLIFLLQSINSDQGSDNSKEKYANENRMPMMKGAATSACSARSWHSRRRHRCDGSSHSCARRRLLLQHRPVECVVILVVQRAEQNPEARRMRRWWWNFFWRKPEELAEIHVVWSLLKSKATAVVEVHGKLRRKTLGGVQYNFCWGNYNIYFVF